MTERLMSDEELMKRLGAHPDLRSQIESLVLAVEDETGDLKTADEAEMRVIEVIRRSGHEALQAWATRQVGKTAQEIKHCLLYTSRHRLRQRHQCRLRQRIS